MDPLEVVPEDGLERLGVAALGQALEPALEPAGAQREPDKRDDEHEQDDHKRDDDQADVVADQGIEIDLRSS